MSGALDPHATPRFLGAVAPDDPAAKQAKAALLGVPYDGAVTYRGGARRGPHELRLASDSIETYCPKLDRDLADHVYVEFEVPEGTSESRNSLAPHFLASRHWLPSGPVLLTQSSRVAVCRSLVSVSPKLGKVA